MEVYIKPKEESVKKFLEREGRMIFYTQMLVWEKLPVKHFPVALLSNTVAKIAHNEDELKGFLRSEKNLKIYIVPTEKIFLVRKDD